MSISTNFPTIKPSLLLDFANVGALDPRITFTRASTGTYYDGVTTVKAEENLLLQSQAFDTSWTTTNVAINSTSKTAPDGTATAEEVRDGTATGGHNLFQGVTFVSGTTYVLSCFMKNVDRQYAILAASGGSGAWASSKFDLSSGVVGSTSQAGAGWSATSSSITSVGNNWYRCVFVFVSGTSGAVNIRVGTATDGTTFTGGGSGLESYTGTDLKIEVWGAQLEQRSSVTAYTATTTQPITNYIPVLQTAAANVARFDHNPTTGEALGLLIEEQRTNLWLQSEDFSTSWTPTNLSVTTNTVVSPAGTLTGEKLVENTSSSVDHIIAQNTAVTSGVTYTMSVYAKQAESGRYLALRFASGTYFSAEAATFNLSTGAVLNTFGTTTATITSVGNGWYRCSITAVSKATGTPAGAQQILVTNSTSATVFSYTGDGYSGIFLWGAQLEAGAFPTSYIATTSAQVTRSADAASMTGTNFSSWFNNGQGTLYAEASIPAFSSSSVLQTTQFAVFTGGGSNMMRVRGYSSGTGAYNWDATGTVNAVSQFDTAERVYSTLNSVVKNALAYKVDDIGNSVNGQTVSTDGSAQIPVCNAASIGSSAIGADFSIQHIRKVAYYPQRLSDTNLVALTS